MLKRLAPTLDEVCSIFFLVNECFDFDRTLCPTFNNVTYQISIPRIHCPCPLARDGMHWPLPSWVALPPSSLALMAPESQLLHWPLLSFRLAKGVRQTAFWWLWWLAWFRRIRLLRTVPFLAILPIPRHATGCHPKSTIHLPQRGTIRAGRSPHEPSRSFRMAVSTALRTMSSTSLAVYLPLPLLLLRLLFPLPLLWLRLLLPLPFSPFLSFLRARSFLSFGPLILILPPFAVGIFLCMRRCLFLGLGSRPL